MRIVEAEIEDLESASELFTEYLRFYERSHDDAAVAGFLVERFVVEGHPPTEIAHIAREMEADLIVMGTHGRTGMAHLFMGSVAERVVRTAPCPVLTLRAAAVPGQSMIAPETASSVSRATIGN